MKDIVRLPGGMADSAVAIFGMYNLPQQYLPSHMMFLQYVFQTPSIWRTDFYRRQVYFVLACSNNKDKNTIITNNKVSHLTQLLQYGYYKNWAPESTQHGQNHTVNSIANIET